MLRLSFSLLLLLWAGAVLGQTPDPVEEEVDSAELRVEVKKPDSLKEKIRFRSLRFGTDLLALILTNSDRFDGWEVNGDADFGRFYLAGDYGYAARDEKLATGGDYHVNGNYWRVGLDVNLLKKDPDRNMLFFGLRYARASYNEVVNYTSTDSYFGPLQYQVSNPAASGSWGELVAGLRVKVWKEFWMGFTSRMKIALAVRGTGDMYSYYVPGFGVIGEGITWGFNYQVFWRIPFERKKKPVPSLP